MQVTANANAAQIGTPAKRRILVLLAHPSLDRSEANRPIADAIAGIEGVTLVDLYAEYPDFQIDIDLEQQRLLAHDVIVFQHPLYWYSTPAILKEWQDLVLETRLCLRHEGHRVAWQDLLQRTDRRRHWRRPIAPRATTTSRSVNSCIRNGADGRCCAA